ncbi:MAG: hypothetical protein EZS28_013475 [Streblomastix strix]|uniref:Uncharacterized protein n=1 Tax=Streblomastix strix TaxID=222440 RepID=A0A5J4W9G5_9EUKA|nr:MAG: hypothetical protein EZS28_013475 [Streblomastix strix]
MVQPYDNSSIVYAGGGVRLIADIQGTSYSKQQDDAVQQLNADKTQLIDSYTNIEADNLSNFKANIGTVTGSSFIQFDANNTVVLLRAGGTKSISEFLSAPTDLSNHYTKTQTYSKTETDYKNVRLEDSIQQTITGRLKFINPFGEKYDESKDPVANTYLTQLKIDLKLTNYVKTVNQQSINGTKKFNANTNASCLVKTGKGDSLILFADGSDGLLSSSDRVQVEDITTTKRKTLTGAQALRDI